MVRCLRLFIRRETRRSVSQFNKNEHSFFIFVLEIPVLSPQAGLGMPHTNCCSLLLHGCKRFQEENEHSFLFGRKKYQPFTARQNLGRLDGSDLSVFDAFLNSLTDQCQCVSPAKEDSAGGIGSGRPGYCRHSPGNPRQRGNPCRQPGRPSAELELHRNLIVIAPGPGAVMAYQPQLLLDLGSQVS